EEAGAARLSGSASREAAETEAPGAEGTERPPNVLFILVDTLRADHMSLYGYARRTSPELERFAAGGVTFTEAMAAKTKTSPSVASLFTGTYPYTHGIVQCRTVLDDSALTLAEVLHGHGFATHSIVANVNVGSVFNFDQGFDEVEDLWRDESTRLAAGVTDHALDWLRSRGQGKRPFFLYVHYLDPHSHYDAPAPFKDMFVGDDEYRRLAGVTAPLGEDHVGVIRESVRLEEHPREVAFYVARYDGEIAYADHQIGRLLDGLRSLGLERDTLVVFTSDHGESLSDHDVYFSHGGFAYDEQARVPLVLRLPGRLPAGARVDAVVQNAALAPTILEALGIEAPSVMELQSLWPVAEGKEEPAPPAGRAAFIEGGHKVWDIKTAIRTRRWELIDNPDGIGTLGGRYDLKTVLNMRRKGKAILLFSTGRQALRRYELYDLEKDPGEMTNLADRRPAVTEELLGRLHRWRERGRGRPRREPVARTDMKEDVIEQLKSLGYVD
ncbi:MAG TPA: sulfatase, partial [Candidatus Saccharimonadales bacterium]|nr:sulfatase [Candidatus Saccharimonadales bacterium]